MSSRKWKSDARVSETSESSSSSATSTPETARARSPAVTPPRHGEDLPRQGEDMPQQGEDTAGEEIADSANLVRSSLSGDGGDGSGKAMAEPRAEDRSLEPVAGTSGQGKASTSARTRGNVATGDSSESAFYAQTCRLCERDTLYVTRSGLSNHAVVHHGCWYSAVRDEFVPIPEEELEEKRKAVQRGQTHRRRRPDPMLMQLARERASGLANRRRQWRL